MWKTLAVAVLLCIANCSFQVYSPDKAKEEVPGEIHYTVANFGHIPYGSTLIGKLRLSEPKDLCTPNESLIETYKN